MATPDQFSNLHLYVFGIWLAFYREANCHSGTKAAQGFTSRAVMPELGLGFALSHAQGRQEQGCRISASRLPASGPRSEENGRGGPGAGSRKADFRKFDRRSLQPITCGKPSLCQRRGSILVRRAGRARAWAWKAAVGGLHERRAH